MITWVPVRLGGRFLEVPHQNPDRNVRVFCLLPNFNFHWVPVRLGARFLEVPRKQNENESDPSINSGLKASFSFCFTSFSFSFFSGNYIFYLLNVNSSAIIHFSRRRKAGIVCLLALLAATFGFTPFCEAHSASGIIFFAVRMVILLCIDSCNSSANNSVKPPNLIVDWYSVNSVS